MDTQEIKKKAIEAISYDKYGTSKDKLIDFALYLLDHGIESENIFILAGLQNDPDYEIKNYFDTVLNELKIEITEDEEIHLFYAKSIAKQVITKEITIYEAIRKFEDLYYQTDYHPYYQEYVDFTDAIDLLKENTYLIEGLNENNIEAYTIRAFELFLEIHRTNLPKDIFEYYYCQSCYAKIYPLQQKKFKIFPYKKYIQLACPLCNSNKLTSFCTNNGKEFYLKEKYNTK